MPTVTDVRTYVTNVRTDTLPRLIYKDYNSPRSWPQHVRHVYTQWAKRYTAIFYCTHPLTRPVRCSQFDLVVAAASFLPRAACAVQMHSVVYSRPMAWCLSVTSQCSIEMAEWIKLGVWHRGYSRLILH